MAVEKQDGKDGKAGRGDAGDENQEHHPSCDIVEGEVERKAVGDDEEKCQQLVGAGEECRIGREEIDE